MVEKYPWNCIRGGWTPSHLGFILASTRAGGPLLSHRFALLEWRGRQGKEREGFPMEKAMQNVSRRGFVGLAGVAAAVAGTAALTGCSPSKKEKNDVACL